MNSVTIKSIVESVTAGALLLSEDWERPWSAQPIPGRRYFVGTPRPGSGCEYTIQWSPRTRTLSAWRTPLKSDDQGWSKRVSASTARVLTSLFGTKLNAQAQPSVEKTGCKCRCNCC